MAIEYIEVSEATFFDRKRFASLVELFELCPERLAKRIPRRFRRPKIGGDESCWVVDVLVELRPHVSLGAEEQLNPVAVGAVDTTKSFDPICFDPILPDIGEAHIV